MTRIALKLAEGQQVQAVNYKPGHEATALFDYMAQWAGRSAWTDAYSVVFHPGKSVSSHDHPEDVVLFYPEGTKGSPCIVEGVETHLEPGALFLVPKRVKHEVPPNPGDTPRVSIAVKVTDE